MYVHVVLHALGACGLRNLEFDRVKGHLRVPSSNFKLQVTLDLKYICPKSHDSTLTRS